MVVRTRKMQTWLCFGLAVGWTSLAGLVTACGEDDGDLVVARSTMMCEAEPHRLRILRRISAEDPNPAESELLTRIRDVTISRDLRVYVLDSGDPRVQVYDASGQYLFRFGASGEGPGEFRSPLSIAISADRVYVLEANNTVEVFSAAGDYVTTVRLALPPPLAMYNSLAVSGDALVLGLTYVWMEGDPPIPPLYGVVLSRWPPETYELTDTLSAQDLTEGGYPRIPIPRRVVAADGDYVLSADRWQLPIEIFDSEGEPLWRFPGCLPFEPNGLDRSPASVPPGGLGGWHTTGGLTSLGAGRFARFNEYTDGTATAPQMVELIDVRARKVIAIPLAPDPTRARRFTGAAFRDSVAIFFNRPLGELVWARLDVAGEHASLAIDPSTP